MKPTLFISHASGGAAAEERVALIRERVHELLKDDPEVDTESEGSEPERFVVVLPRRSAD